MKKTKILLSIIFIAIFTSSLLAADPVAVIIKVKGDITIKNAASGKSITAKDVVNHP